MKTIKAASLLCSLFFIQFNMVSILGQSPCPNVEVTTIAGLASNAGFINGAGSIARFNNPSGMAFEQDGNVLIADVVNNVLRRMTPTGVVSTFLTGTFFSTPADITIDGLGNVYVSNFAKHTISKITPNGVVSTFAGLAFTEGSIDGSGSTARFKYPNGLTVDAAGNIYVADQGNNVIRKITPSGVVSTLVGSPGLSGSLDGTGSSARFNAPRKITADAVGNLYVSDYNNHTIRKITPAGVVSTLVGSAGNTGNTDGTGLNARFNRPDGLTIDGLGNIYVADWGNHTIRKVTSIGIVSTIAGFAGAAGSTDGNGNSARFRTPTDVEIDMAGNIYVADGPNHIIRKIGNCTNACTAQFTSNRDDFSCLGYTFSNESTGDNLTYYWNFGDGQLDTTTQNNLLFHTYPDYGNYTVTLIVEGADGCRDTTNQNIQLVNQLEPLIHGISAVDSCCAAFGMNTTRDVSEVEIEILTPGVTFDNTILFPGFQLASHSTSTKAVIQSSFFPFPISSGNYISVLDFCFNADIQDVDYAINWYFRPAEAPFLICSDTLSYFCATDKCQPNLTATTFSTTVETPELGGVKSNESFYSGIVDCNGNYVALGTLDKKGPHTKNFPLYLAKFDQNGHLIGSTKQVESPINTAIFDVQHMDLIQVDSCNGYLAVAAYTEDQTTWKTMLIRFDNNCNLLYTKKVDLGVSTFAGGNSTVQPNQLIQDSNGDFLVIGTMDNGVNSNILLFRWNESSPGTICETRSYFLSGTTNDKGMAITEVTNLGTTKYLVTGQRDGQLLLLSVDNNLSPLQTKIYQIKPSSNDDIGRSIKQIYTSSDIVISGETSNGTASNWLLMKVSGSSATFGVVDWVKKGTLGIPGQREVGMDIEIGDFGEILMGGYTFRNGDPTYNPDSEGLLIKFTSAGVPIWTRTYTPNSNFAKIYDIARTPDNGLVLFGNQWTFDLSKTTAYYDFWVAKTDEKGLLTEASCYNCPDIEIESVIPTITTQSLFNFNYTCSINDCPMSLVDEPMNLQTFCGESLATNCDSMATSNTFSTMINQNGSQFGTSITEKTNGDLIVLGNTNTTSNTSNLDLQVSILDPVGNEQTTWQFNNTGSSNREGAGEILEISDICAGQNSAYAITGNLYATQEVMFLKVDQNGNPYFSEAIGFPGKTNNLNFQNLIQSSNGDVLVVGSMDANNNGIHETIVYNAKGDCSGSWLKTYEEMANLNRTSITEVSGLAGTSGSGPFYAVVGSGGNQSSIFMFIINANGDLQFGKVFKFKKTNAFQTYQIADVKQLSTKEILITGAEGTRNPFLLKIGQTNQNPDILFSPTDFYIYNISGGRGGYPRGIAVDANDEITFGGWMNSLSAPYQNFMFQLDANPANIKWANSYMPSGKEVATFEDLHLTRNGSFVGAGYEGNFAISDFFVVQTDSEGRLSNCECSDTISIDSESIPWELEEMVLNASNSNDFRTIQFEKVNVEPDQIFCDQNTAEKPKCDLVDFGYTIIEESPKDSCCFTINLTNEIDSCFTCIRLDAVDMLTLWEVGVPQGWRLREFVRGEYALICPSNYVLPTGNDLDFARICLSGFTTNTQQIQVSVLGNAPDLDTLCRDTLVFHCEPPPPLPKCVKIVNDSVYCEGADLYGLDFDIMVNSLINFKVKMIEINAPPGITLMDSTFIFMPPLDSNTVNGTYSTTISGGNPGDSICLFLTAHDIDVNSNDTLNAHNCCTDTIRQICIVLPDCNMLTKCDSIDVGYTIMEESPKDSCCFMINLTNEVDSCFTCVRLDAVDLLTLWEVGVPQGWRLREFVRGEYALICPNNYVLPTGNNLDFARICLSGFTTNTQQIQVSILGNAPDLDTLCRDTLVFHCEPPPPLPKCVKIVNDSVYCEGDGLYGLDFDIMVDSLINFKVKMIEINAPPGITLMDSTFIFMPPLDSNTVNGTYSTTISGGNPGDSICLFLTAHDIDVNSNDTLNAHNCCTDTIRQICIVLPDIPVITITDQTICADENPFDLTTLEPSGQTGGIWKIAGSNVSNPSNETIANGAVYSYCYTDGNGCTGIAQVTFTVHNLPEINIPNQAICADDNPFDLTTLEPSGQTGGIWKIAGSNVPNPSNETIANGAVYSYCYTDGNSCTGIAQVTFTVEICSPCGQVSATPLEMTDVGSDSCCWGINLVNNYSPNFFTSIETEIITPNVTFGVLINPLFSGFDAITRNDDRQITWTPEFPNGSHINSTATLSKFCLRNIVNPTQNPQRIEVRWMVNDSIACRDTVETDCVPILLQDDCADIENSRISCNNDGTYQYTFDVKNNTATQMEGFALVNVSPSGSINPTSFSVPIAPNSSVTNQTVTITGNSGDQVCFKINLHDINNGNHFNCCFNDDLICVTLPTCGPPTTGSCCLALSAPINNPFNLSGGNSWQGIDFLKDGGLYHYVFGSLNTVKVASNIGTANVPNYDLSAATTISGPYSVRKPYNYDYNQDGNDDYFAKDESTNEIIYFENNGNLNFTAYPTGVIIQAPIADGLNFIAIGDLSNDGLPDLVVTNRGAYNNGTGILVHYYEHLSVSNCSNNGIPCFSLTASNPLIDDNFLTPNGGTPIPEIFDGDCDGDEDLYIGIVGNIWEFKNNGGVVNAGALPDLERVSYTSNPYGISGIANSSTEFVAPRFVDVDNDGKSELFIDDYTQLLFYENCENDTIPSNCVGGVELITNGEFTDGNTAFTSEYTYTTGCPDRDYPIDPYQCTLINDYDDVCAFSIAPPPIQDYTTGSGLFLLFSDGYFSLAKPVRIAWKQENITVTPNTNYKLSAWVDFVDVQNENADLTFRINGQIIFSSRGTHLVHKGWEYLEGLWASGTTTSIDLEIITNNNLRPNTIALDNISLKECGKIDPCPIIRTEEGNVYDHHALFAQTEIRSSVKIFPNAALTYQAGNTIHLRPGFHATAGSQFTASIANSFDCGPVLKLNRDDSNILTENQPVINQDQLRLNVAPNPFSRHTTIKFFLPFDGLINLSIKDINGRTIAPIFKGNQQKGAHQIQFNNSDLLPGIYYLVMHTEEKIISKKVILLNN